LSRHVIIMVMMNIWFWSRSVLVELDFCSKSTCGRCWSWWTSCLFLDIPATRCSLVRFWWTIFSRLFPMNPWLHYIPGAILWFLWNGAWYLPVRNAVRCYEFSFLNSFWRCKWKSKQIQSSFAVVGNAAACDSFRVVFRHMPYLMFYAIHMPYLILSSLPAPVLSCPVLTWPLGEEERGTPQRWRLP